MLQIEAVRVVPVSARIEVKVVATEGSGFPEQPAHQCIGVPSSSVRRQRDQIVDIDEVAPHEVVSGPEAGHPRGILGVVIIERADQSVSLRTLDLVHLSDELAPG